MKIICFGNRGSRALGASADSRFGQYGGDTTSIGVICDDGTLIALDAGSGAWKWPYTIKELLEIKGPIEMHMFFSHYHDDHKTGFPQLEQLFMPENTFHIYGPSREELYRPEFPIEDQFDLRRMFQRKSSADNPGLSSVYQAKINLTELQDGGLEHNNIVIGEGIKLSWIRVGHGQQYSYGYRIDHNDQSFSIISDTHHLVDGAGRPQLDDEIVSFIKGSDVFMSDSHYTDDEFNKDPKFAGEAMGHSTGEHGVRLSNAAGVPIFIPHHYSPLKTDLILDKEINELRRYASEFHNVSVVASKPSLVIDLSIPAEKRVLYMRAQSTAHHRQMAIRGELAL